MGNIGGSFQSLDRSTLNGLQRALQNDGQVDALETEAIAEAALADGHFSAGEQALIGQLRQA
ncbi:MAG: hypothetical protein ACAI44_36575, partial [Candidatus Sericytochromatia bacterium]